MAQLDDHTNAIVDALLADDVMRERESYLKRGRSYKQFTESDLRSQWIASFKAAVHTDDANAKLHLSDSNAEMLLRDLSLPHDEVADDMAILRSQIRAAGPDDLGVRKRIAEFLDDLNKPKN